MKLSKGIRALHSKATPVSDEQLTRMISAVDLDMRSRYIVAAVEGLRERVVSDIVLNYVVPMLRTGRIIAEPSLEFEAPVGIDALRMNGIGSPMTGEHAYMVIQIYDVIVVLGLGASVFSYVDPWNGSTWQCVSRLPEHSNTTSWVYFGSGLFGRQRLRGGAQLLCRLYRLVGCEMVEQSQELPGDSVANVSGLMLLRYNNTVAIVDPTDAEPMRGLYRSDDCSLLGQWVPVASAATSYDWPSDYWMYSYG